MTVYLWFPHSLFISYQLENTTVIESTLGGGVTFVIHHSVLSVWCAAHM